VEHLRLFTSKRATDSQCSITLDSTLLKAKIDIMARLEAELAAECLSSTTATGNPETMATMAPTQAPQNKRKAEDTSVKNARNSSAWTDSPIHRPRANFCK